MRYLLLSDIHGNYPALEAVAEMFPPTDFDLIINCGDSLVYAPFANETLEWLQQNNVLSILGNTDKKVLKLLRGKTFKKPSKPDKRVMYTHSAESLSPKNSDYLQSLPKLATAVLPDIHPTDSVESRMLGIFHGSPAAHHEFLFSDSPDSRFIELAAQYPYRIIVTGHSHSPYHKKIGATHFINPGSVGRMFDGDPAAGCAIITTSAPDGIAVELFRIPYDTGKTIAAIREANLPEIYTRMYETGRKLN